MTRTPYSIHPEYGIGIQGRTNRWSAVDKREHDNITYLLFENDTYGDETAYIICTWDGTQWIEICETYDDIETALSDEGIVHINREDSL